MAPRFIVDVNVGQLAKWLRAPTCRMLYWRGTHWRSLEAEIAGFMKGA